MKEYRTLKVSVEDNIALVILNNPPANVLTTTAFSELLDVVSNCNNDPSIRVIILTAEGRIFAAGADISEIEKIQTAEEGERLCRQVQELTLEMQRSKIPIIAAINGICLGGGNELAMSCHIRIASDRARFGQPEINLGIIPGAGGTQRLPRLVGRGKGLELLMTGDQIPASEAKAIGLVDLVVPDAELRKRAIDLAKKISSKSRQAITRLLRAVEDGLKLPLEEGLKLEARLFGELILTEDKSEGIKAFKEKRQPQFKDK